jgi:adenylate cyclase
MNTGLVSRRCKVYDLYQALMSLWGSLYLSEWFFLVVKEQIGPDPHLMYAFMGFRLDPGGRQLLAAEGRPIALTSRVFDTLLYFVEHRGELLDKDTLMQAIWPDTVVEENSLNQAISALRKALGQTPGEHRFILTEAGRGYRFVAEVQILPGELEPVVTPPQSIAVLPFVNMSPDPNQEYFADGVAEELLNQLAQIKGLMVTGRTSSFYFKGRNEDVKVIGDKLGVANILEGSVRKAGNRVRVNVQLITVDNGYNLWSDSYDRELDDIFAIQEDIARRVAEALSVTFGLGETTITPGLSGDVVLYDRYLRARALYNKSGPANLDRAAELYSEVLAQVPEYAPARAALVDAYIDILSYIPERRPETILALEALTANKPAREDWATDYASAILHFQRYEWTEAERAFETAMEQAPATWVHVGWIGVLNHLGRYKDAIRTAQQTLRTDPLSSPISYWLQLTLYCVGQREEAEAEYQRSLDFSGASEPIEHLALLRVWDDGDAQLIRSRFQRFLEFQFLSAPVFTAVRDVFDDRDAALTMLRAAHGDPAYQDPTRQFLISWYAAHYNDNELTLAAMRRSVVDLRGANFVGGLWWPGLATARREPAFKDIVRDIGLFDYWRETGNWGEFCHPVGEDDFECE